MPDILAIDTETHPFGQGDMAPRIVCLTWAHGAESGILGRDEIVRTMLAALERAALGQLLLVGHNIAYDMVCMMAGFEELRRPIWRAYEAGAVRCTYVREKLIDIAEGLRRGDQDDDGAWEDYGYSLADCARRRLGRELDKSTWRLGYDKLDGTPIKEWPAGAVKYAVDDAIAARDLYLDQARSAERGRIPLSDEVLQARADLALKLASTWGVRTDKVAVDALHKRTQERMFELHQGIAAAGLLNEKGGKSMKAIRDRILARYPGGKPPLTKTKAIMTSKLVMEACDDPALDLVVEFSSLQKSGSTYIRHLYGGVDHPIHAGFDVLGAASGRTSSFKPNIQNQPRLPGVRECFVPRAGHVFVSCDYDSQELRTLAQACLWICNRSTLADSYRANPDFDPHTRLAARLVGISYEEAMRLKKSDKHVKEMRQRAKAANFGFPGGMGAKKFRLYAKGYGVDISEGEAKGLRDSWFAELPEMDPYFKHVESVVGQGDAGRQVFRTSGRIRGLVSYTECANGYFQGTAADISKTALFEASRRCYDVETSALFGARIWNFVHDSIELEVEEARAHAAAMELEQIMVEAAAKLCPDVPFRATPALMRRWSKDADAAWKDGRLIPWEDKPKEKVA